MGENVMGFIYSGLSVDEIIKKITDGLQENKKPIDKKDYDADRAHSLVGTIIKYQNDEWLVTDHIHWHFFLVRISDGYFKFEEAVDVLNKIDETSKLEKIFESCNVQKIFEENGYFTIKSYDRDVYVIGAEQDINRPGVSLKSLYMCMSNVYNWTDEIKYGKDFKNNMYFQTIEIDTDAKFGMNIIGKDRFIDQEININTAEWHPLSHMYDDMVAKYEEHINTHLDLKGTIKFHRNVLAAGQNANFTFWEENSNKCYKFVGPQENGNYSLFIGRVDKQPTATTMGKAVRGSSYKWNMEKKNEIGNIETIKEEILSFVKQVVKKIIKDNI